MNALCIARRVPERAVSAALTKFLAAILCLSTALLIALSIAQASPANAAGFQPEDFDVNIDMGPGSGGGEPQEPTCTTNPDMSQTCTNEMDYVADDRTSDGTVVHVGSGLAGTIQTLCDMEMHHRFSSRMTPTTIPGDMPSMEVIDISGSMRQLCSWHMSFDDGSELNGRIAGSMNMALIDAATGTVRLEASFNVDVVYGAGQFAGTVGSGTFGHSEEFSVFGDGPGDGPGPGGPGDGPGPGGPGDGPGGGGPGPGSQSLAARAADAPVSALAGGSGMNLELRKGAPRVRVVSPAASIERGDKSTLQAVTAPKARCKARATRGSKRVSLGSARAKANGNVAFRGAVGAKLKSGKWTLAVRCRTSRGTATDRSSVGVS